MIHLANCKECPFSKDGQPERPVLGEGDPTKAIAVLVGEGPGREESEQGRPFVGVTGRQLDEELLSAGLLRTQCLVLNSTCCVPTKRDDRAMKLAVQCCHAVFRAQMAQVDTTKVPVLAMGKWALYACTLRDKSISNARGFHDKRWKEVPQGEQHHEERGLEERECQVDRSQGQKHPVKIGQG